MKTEIRNILKNCQYCGKEFLAARESSKYCGSTCRVAHHRLVSEYVVCIALNEDELSNYREAFKDQTKTKTFVTAGLYAGVDYSKYYLFSVEKEYFHSKIKPSKMLMPEFESYVTAKPTKIGNRYIHVKW